MNKWHIVVVVLHPALRGLLQCVVIIRLVMVDLFLERNVLSYIEAVFVEQQKGEQPRHSAVAVTEWMDTKEVQNNAGNKKKLVDIGVGTGIQIGQFQLLHSSRCLCRRCGTKPHTPRAIRRDFQNHIVIRFVLSTVLVACDCHHGFMKPQNVTNAEGQVLIS